MADYSEGDARDARRIADSLFEGEALGKELDQGLSIVDVETDARAFAADLDFLSWAGEKALAMNVAEGPSVPISLSLFFPFLRGAGRHRRRFTRHPYLYEELMYELRSVQMAGFENEIVRLDIDQARENFRSRAVVFLANRLAAVRRAMASGTDDLPETRPTLRLPQFLGGPATSVVGCNFSVFSQSSGLAAYWSGAYYISPNNHGGPTSPATAPLQAGTYIFGVDGGAYGSNIQWDQNKVCTLPGNASVHLPY